MNFKKSILILSLFFFTALQSQTMLTTNIQSRLLNKYWSPNVGDANEVVFFFTQNEVTLFVGNKKIGSEPYYITSNSEVTTPTTFSNAKVGTTSSGNCIKTNSSFFIVEFFSDFQSFRWKRSFDPDQLWQTYTQKSTPFFNSPKSGLFTRNNCGAGNIGFEQEYVVEAGKHISYVSQADADAQADADVLNNGQNFVNGDDGSFCVYYNLETTREVTKNDCPTGKVGSKVSHTVPAGKYNSEVSEADLAVYVDNEFNQWGLGQQNANTNGVCLYTNVEVTRFLHKNNCPVGTSHYYSPYYYVVKAGKYFSAVSEAEVDALVQLEFDTVGQNLANGNGICIFKSTSITRTYTNMNCAPGKLGTIYTNITNAGLYTSNISQADADGKAQTANEYWGQYNANQGTCGTYLNAVKSSTFRRNSCIGAVGALVTYTVPAGKYFSDVSQSDADSKAQFEVNSKGQQNANMFGGCNGL